jgi:hypothetical protein
MEALSQLSYSPERKTLFPKESYLPLASWRRIPVGIEGRENTRNLRLAKR